jgi:5-methylcytosine-specific restriction endonuclease McrA
LTAHVMHPMASPDGCPALVLNADFRPLSYYPLSLWSWQDAIKAVFMDRVNIVSEYDTVVRSPSFNMKLPSVVSLKTYIKPSRTPAFTRFNVFLRDRFSCQYCTSREDLTFDHVIPRSKGGLTTWENVVAACSPCNLRKGDKMPAASRCSRRRSPTRRRSTICTATASSSRRITCTRAGSIISTGIPNWSREPA